MVPLSSKALLEMRKVLFKRGIRPLELLSVILECVADHDSNLEYFFDLVKTKQIERMERGEQKSIGMDTFYDFFEKKFMESKGEDSNDKEEL